MLALAAGLIAACGGKTEEGSGTPAGGESAAGDVSALPEAPKGTASIKGVIKLSGTAPQDSTVEPADMSATDPICAKMHTETVQLSEYVVSADGGVANVLVYVKEGAKPSRPAAENANLDQKGCLYHPKVFGVQVGQNLHITSSDETAHNVNCQTTKNRKFNRGFANKGASFDIKFQKPEVLIQFKCDIHPWMYAYAGILEHPFYAVSGADGSFEIKNLPAGPYTIEAVHAKLGTQTSQPVTVADGEVKTVDFQLQASGS
jgi:plastocyanin